MSESMWETILQQLEEHPHMGEISRTSERVDETAEVFTPSRLVIEMLQSAGVAQFAPGRKVLDPACGDGQFLVAVKWVKMLAHGMSEQDALQDLYGIDIMRDNVELCRRRLGGGTILHGNALHPSERLEGQTEDERSIVMELLNES